MTVDVTKVISGAASVTMGLMLIVLLVRYFVLPFREGVLPVLAGAAPVKRRARKITGIGQVLAFVGAAYLVSRALIFIVSAIATKGALLQDPLGPFMRWDASHYVGLGENWYVNEGDARLHLVFFPLYPLLIRALHLIGVDGAVAGVLLSNGCLIVSGWALYRLVELDEGAQSGERAVRLFMFAPLSFFFSIAYSESLFFMLTIVSVLMARRRRFALAVALGALASASRLLGLLVAVPIFYEYLLVVREKKGGAREVLVAFLKCLPVALGFVAYLYLNQVVTGDPFTFLTYQKEHWSQQMGSLYNTLSYTLSNALAYDSLALQLGTWIPQALMILASIALLIATYRRISPGDGAYALLYIYFAVSPTWLLSGTRYLAAMYALYPMLAVLTQRRSRDIAAMAISVLLTIYMIVLFFQNGVL